MKNNKMICIIDDDPLFIEGTKTIIDMSRTNNDYVVYYNGEDALKAISEKINNSEILPDIIFLDLNMPIMDGWQFLKAFSELAISICIPIYVVSSSINQNDILRAKSFKCVVDYIEKPISFDVLDKILSN
jgi:CheY-like chemotaxis protein